MTEIDFLAAFGFGPSPMRIIWDVCSLLYKLRGGEHSLKLFYDWDDERLVVVSRRIK